MKTLLSRIVPLGAALAALAAMASAQAARSDRHVIHHTTHQIHHLNRKLRHQTKHHQILAALGTQAKIGQAKLRRAYHKEDLRRRH